MLGPWGIWAELWCYTDGLSCPMQPTPANARALATRWRCSSTPAWLARTVLKGFCFIARKHNTSYYLWINVNTYSLVCFSMSLFMKVLSDAYPRSLTVLTLLYMLTMQQPMAIYCMYGLIHLFIYEFYFFNLWTPLFWVHSFLCAPFWFTTWTSSLNGFFCRKLFGIYSVYLQYSREQKRMCCSFIFKKLFQNFNKKIQKFLICCNFFNSLMLHMVNEKKLN